MSRWAKSIVVPLDALCKEKENTNRPTVARSVGTVGKWGKMGFTSTRTYALSALPAVAAAAAAAAAVTSPAQSPASPLDDDLSLSVPEPPKPKKFFKSRNTAPPEVIAQIIQQLPNCVSTSPTRDTGSSHGTMLSTPVHEPIKLKIGKSNSAERKKKTSTKKRTAVVAASAGTVTAGTTATLDVGGGGVATEELDAKPAAESKVKKKKEKELKPEAPPSRILGRARKVVNYREVDDDEDLRSVPRNSSSSSTSNCSRLKASMTAAAVETEMHAAVQDNLNRVLPPPQMVPSASGMINNINNNNSGSNSNNCSNSGAGSSSINNNSTNNNSSNGSAAVAASKTPEHPPIVLRISKGTSRLVSTDSEEPPNCSPAQQQQNYQFSELDSINAIAVTTTTTEIAKSRHASIDEVVPANYSNNNNHNNNNSNNYNNNTCSAATTAASVAAANATVATVIAAAASTPKIILKPPKPPPPPLPLSLAVITPDIVNPNIVTRANNNDDEQLNQDNENEEEGEEEDDEEEDEEEIEEEEPPEINYCTVKISPDKPPKERLKLIIKTDVIRNAIAKAAAAAAAKEAAAAERAAAGIKTRGEKKSKSKKHKHLKHAAMDLLHTSSSNMTAVTAIPTATAATTITHTTVALTSTATVVTMVSTAATTTTSGAVAACKEFKTPSPHLAFNEQHIPTHRSGVVISPTVRSEHDFDSQSSVLGSISSKGNSTPQPLAQTVQEESCVIHSRGSSVITSDLETSQHSSLVAPPSDIESRLESMMMTMDGGGISNNEVNQRVPTVEEPLQEDILAVLRGEEDEANMQTTTTTEKEQNQQLKLLNGAATMATTENPNAVMEGNELMSVKSTKRVTRGRGRKAANNEVKGMEETVATTATRTRARGRATQVATAASATVETTAAVATKRTTRRAAAKKHEIEVDQPMEVEVMMSDAEVVATMEEQLTTRGRSRAIRNNNNNKSSNNNNNNSNNNNNINKIAANLSAKATEATNKSGTGVSSARGQRSYGRKRKNQQVTQVLQPELYNAHDANSIADDDDNGVDDYDEHDHATPAKVPHTELDYASYDYAECSNNSNMSGSTLPNDGSSSSPPRRDYKFKDKFKRTLILESQMAANQNHTAAAAATNVAAAAPAATVTTTAGTATTSSHKMCGAIKTQVEKTDTPNIDDEQQPQQQQQRTGVVKLVISKKKGSIFKSRALVPSDQAEQATVAKRHLYKHSWDAAQEANGAGNGSDVSNASPSTAAGSGKSNDGSKSAVDNIYGDFGDSSTTNHSAVGIARGDSPALGKLTRVIKPNPQATNALGNNVFDLDDDGNMGASVADTITSMRIDRKGKEYYTVVRNVKTAHQIQEIGEYQEMDDDVEYILDALQPHNPPATRCLSALQLATKCMTPAFRMHVRAHGVVTKFFKALSDANKDLSLGLCTSAIMYILSQEGLNMDLDCDSLELMMNLLEAEGVAAPSDRANYERNKQKVRELCEEIKAQGKATHLNVDSITVGTLAMETLLSLTSKRAGEWFKEDLRKLGGLEHIIKTISEYCRPAIECSNNANMYDVVWTQALLDNMQTVARCLRVLENVTQHNEENQKYMLTYANGSAVNTLCTLYRLCDHQLLLHPTVEDTNSSSGNNSEKEHPGVVMRELLTPVLKVLINLTHAFNTNQPSLGAELLSNRSDVIETSFHLLLLAPNYIPDRCVFELSILVLMLLINLCMHTLPNRAILMRTFAPPEYIAEKPQDTPVTAVQAVMEYFYKCEELARLVEKNTDAFLENSEKHDEVDETVNNLMQRAGHHMEHTLKGSYAGILIGHLITENDEYERVVRTHLRSNSFKELIGVLEKYHTFMNLTASSESTVVAHIKSTKKLIDDFKKRDYIYENSDDSALPLNLEMMQHHQSIHLHNLHHNHHHQESQNHHNNSQSAANSSYSSASSSSNTSITRQMSATTPTDVTSPGLNSSPPSSPPQINQATTRSTLPRVFKTYSHR